MSHNTTQHKPSAGKQIILLHCYKQQSLLGFYVDGAVWAPPRGAVAPLTSEDRGCGSCRWKRLPASQIRWSWPQCLRSSPDCSAFCPPRPGSLPPAQTNKNILQQALQYCITPLCATEDAEVKKIFFFFLLISPFFQSYLEDFFRIKDVLFKFKMEIAGRHDGRVKS